MPKTGSKSGAGKGGKSSKTARVLSLLTDPAGVSDASDAENNNNNNQAPAREESAASRMDDKAAQEQIRDALVSELFGKKPAGRPPRTSNASAGAGRRADAPPRRRNAPPSDTDALDDLPDDSPENPPAGGGSGGRDQSVRSARERARAARPSGVDKASSAPDAAPAPASNPASDASPANTPSAASAEDDDDWGWGPPASGGSGAPEVTDWDEWDFNADNPPARRADNPPARETTPPVRRANNAPENTPPVTRANNAPANTPPVTRANTPPRAADKNTSEPDYICFNLTQTLVEDKAKKYMKSLDMCTCNRCTVDVTAIALSNLPSKYVATRTTEMIPLLSMYESKNSAAVTAQVLNACELVKRRPHHGR